MREISPGFITPLGVWINRESVREALRRSYRKFNTLEDALKYVNTRFTINIEEWAKMSVLIQNALHQEKITKYF